MMAAKSVVSYTDALLEVGLAIHSMLPELSVVRYWSARPLVVRLPYETTPEPVTVDFQTGSAPTPDVDRK